MPSWDETMSDSAIKNLELRVEKLEKAVSAFAGQNTSAKPRHATPSESSTPRSEPSQLVKDQTKDQAPRAIQTPKPPLDQPTSTSGNSQFLGAVGVICFILAGSYSIRLGITGGWITPTLQLLAVAVLGMALIMAGFALRDKDNQYASFLPAGGVALLYMAAYGGHLYYEIYEFSVAKIFANSIAIGSIALFVTFKQRVYALAACAGSYMVPFLLGFQTWDLGPLCFYMAVWDIAFSVIGVLVGSRLLVGLTAYIALLSFGIFGQGMLNMGGFELASALALFQATQFLFFCVMMTWYSVARREPLLKAEAWAFFPLLLLFYLIEHELIVRFAPSYAAWCAVGFAVWIWGLYRFAKRVFGAVALQSLPMVACFISVIAVHAVYYGLTPPLMRPFMGIAVAAIFMRWLRISSGPSEYSGAMIVLSWIVIIEYFGVLFGSAERYSASSGLLLNFVYATTLLLLARESRESNFSGAGVVRVLGGIQLLFGLKNASELILSPAAAAFGTSALWSLTAFVVLLTARKNDDRALASDSMWLFGIVALKLLLIDLSATSSAAKIIALLIIGGLFYLGGFVYRGIGAERTP